MAHYAALKGDDNVLTPAGPERFANDAFSTFKSAPHIAQVSSRFKTTAER